LVGGGGAGRLGLLAEGMGQTLMHGVGPVPQHRLGGRGVSLPPGEARIKEEFDNPYFKAVLSFVAQLVRTWSQKRQRRGIVDFIGLKSNSLKTNF
jgi:hypothetical protein